MSLITRSTLTDSYQQVRLHIDQTDAGFDEAAALKSALAALRQLVAELVTDLPVGVELYLAECFIQTASQRLVTPGLPQPDHETKRIFNCARECLDRSMYLAFQAIRSRGKQ